MELAENKAFATIIVVDDDKMTREFVARLLERKGYAVTAAESGEDALKQWKLASSKPRLLIADLCMPGMGGKGIAALLKKLQPGIKVLFISGSGFDLMQEAVDAVPDSRHLFKPFRIDQLLGAVETILAAA